MKREFTKHIDSLQAVFDFLTEFVEQEELPDEMLPGLHLAIEEIFVNLVRYNSSSQNDIAIVANQAGGVLTIELQDRDVERYDLTKRKEVDTNASLEERRPGGLGVHFVRQIMDDVQYEYENRTSTIRLIKRVEE